MPILSASQLPSHITIIKAWRHGETNANKFQLLAGGSEDDQAGLKTLNEEGKKQAETLGKLVSQSGTLDIIYTSDLSRAIETSNGVIKAFAEKGIAIEQRLSKQLREILHGKFELTEAAKRKENAEALFSKMFEADANGLTAEEELKDRYRFWKIHPLASKEEITPEEIVDVESYIQHDETRAETPYQLWQRIHQEFIRIAQENPAATVGISTHGACLATLIDGLNPQSKGTYLPPHYHGKEIKVVDQVILPAAAKVENCALILFKYDSKKNKLELCIDEECSH